MLEVRGLTAGYGPVEAIAGVDLDVAAGECVAVVGPNGAGKTTLLKALMGLVRARAARLTLDGADMAGLPTHMRSRAGMAWAPQGREIFTALSVRENLALAALGRPGGPARAIDAATARFPVLAPLLDRPGGALSGGEQQILSLARALCAGPRLLLLDEPTEGIQASVVETLGETLRDLVAGGLAALLVEQNLDFVEAVAGRVATLDRGRLDGGGPVTNPGAVPPPRRR